MYIYGDMFQQFANDGDVGTPRLPPVSLAPGVWYAPGAICGMRLSLVQLRLCLPRLVFVCFFCFCFCVFFFCGFSYILAFSTKASEQFETLIWSGLCGAMDWAVILRKSWALSIQPKESHLAFHLAKSFGLKFRKISLSNGKAFASKEKEFWPPFNGHLTLITVGAHFSHGTDTRTN